MPVPSQFQVEKTPLLSGTDLPLTGLIGKDLEGRDRAEEKEKTEKTERIGGEEKQTN